MSTTGWHQFDLERGTINFAEDTRGTECRLSLTMSPDCVLTPTEAEKVAQCLIEWADLRRGGAR